MHIRIIAEAGVNHNRSLGLAKELAQKAKQAGADYVKYQTFVPELLAAGSAKKAPYQKESTGNGSQLDMLRKLCLSFDEFHELKGYCDEIGITFLSTPFDMQSMAFLRTLNMPFWKVPSGELTNLPYLEEIARSGLPVVLSTGMATLDEIGETVALLQTKGVDSITLLHCTTEYPTPMADVNLIAMDTLRERFHLPVGYSDHTEGITIPVAAAAKGAVVLEKHFTLDKGMEGPDHKASLEPWELAEMVRCVRMVEEALGDGVKAPKQSETGNRAVARKSIVAAVPIESGDIFTAEMLMAKRPGEGISPMRWYDVIGQRANRKYEADELIDGEVIMDVSGSGSDGDSSGVRPATTADSAARER